MPFIRTSLLPVAFCIAVLAPCIVGAQDTKESNGEPVAVRTTGGAAAAPAPEIRLAAQFGFASNWKLGHICPVRIDLEGLSTADQSLDVQVQTLDGDDGSFGAGMKVFAGERRCIS